MHLTLHLHIPLNFNSGVLSYNIALDFFFDSNMFKHLLRSSQLSLIFMPIEYIHRLLIAIKIKCSFCSFYKSMISIAQINIESQLLFLYNTHTNTHTHTSSLTLNNYILKPIYSNYSYLNINVSIFPLLIVLYFISCIILLQALLYIFIK